MSDTRTDFEQLSAEKVAAAEDEQLGSGAAGAIGARIAALADASEAAAEQPDEPDDAPPDDPYSEPCETCRGWGRVRTGSKVPDETERGCQDCAGKGWTVVVQDVPAPPVEPADNGDASQATQVEPAGGWGRWSS